MNISNKKDAVTKPLSEEKAPGHIIGTSGTQCIASVKVKGFVYKEKRKLHNFNIFSAKLPDFNFERPKNVKFNKEALILIPFW